MVQRPMILMSFVLWIYALMSHVPTILHLMVLCPSSYGAKVKIKAGVESEHNMRDLVPMRYCMHWG